MRKDRIYNVRVCCTVPPHPDISADVQTAYYICPAGLAGSCNHVAALLYALEDFVRNGLREEAAKTCTEKLKAWNRPRARKVKPRQISKVFLVKEEFSKRESKRLRIRKPYFDPRPRSERLLVVQELNNFISDLCTAHEDLLAKNPVLVNQYGSSSWLKLLEPTPPPSSASSESPDSAPSDTDSSCDGEQFTDHFQLSSSDCTPEDFYKREVVISREGALKLEKATRLQSSTTTWHKARHVRVTSTMAMSAS